MTAANVVNLYSQLENEGIKIWIDGGWGVDALLEKQTRHHKDIDIVIEQKDLPRFRTLMSKQGYKDTKVEEARPQNFVLADAENHEIDVHVISVDDKGNGIYGPIEKGEMYPADSLTGIGKIDNLTIRCISAEHMIKFHSGYQIKEKDYKDVSALCERFDIDLPEEYRIFQK